MNKHPADSIADESHKHSTEPEEIGKRIQANLHCKEQNDSKLWGQGASSCRWQKVLAF